MRPLTSIHLQGTRLDSGSGDMLKGRVRDTCLLTHEVLSCFLVAIPHKGTAVHGVPIVEGVTFPLPPGDNGQPGSEKLLDRVENLLIHQLEYGSKNTIFILKILVFFLRTLLLG